MVNCTVAISNAGQSCLQFIVKAFSKKHADGSHFSFFSSFDLFT